MGDGALRVDAFDRCRHIFPPFSLPVLLASSVLNRITPNERYVDIDQMHQPSMLHRARQSFPELAPLHLLLRYVLHSCPVRLQQYPTLFTLTKSVPLRCTGVSMRVWI